MRAKLSQLFDVEHTDQLLFNVFALMILLCIFVGIGTEMYFVAGAPAALVIAYLAIVDFRRLFFLLLACIPISTEVVLPNGFGTDLPTEPLMIGLMFVYLLYVLRHGAQLSRRFIQHPITLLVLLHLGWILTTTVLSDLLFVSIKFSLAKIWYISVFYFMAGSLLKTEKDVKSFFWIIFIPLLATVIIILIRHAAIGFSFEDVHKVFYPFHRNHVNYAGIIALFFPIMVLATQWYNKKSIHRRLLIFSLILFFIAIYFSFTRAAYVALFIALGYYFVVQLRLTRPLVLASLLGLVLGMGYMIQDNRYLDYAPNFERTITHKNFNNLIEATYQMEDISTMERVYRWVAGGHMIADHPFLGYGPGNFVNFYERYTVTGFQTYVSDNEERSGIHSYYLMTAVEQGLIGLAIFLLLVFYTLIRGEQIYHRIRDVAYKRIALMMLLVLVVINAFQIINDLLETDKIGPFFFMAMAMLVNSDLATQEDEEESDE